MVEIKDKEIRTCVTDGRYISYIHASRTHNKLQTNNVMVYFGLAQY